MKGDFYSHAAKGYNELHREEQLKKLEIIAQHIKPKAPMLDIGAGTGISTRFFGIDSVALEPSFEMVKQHDGKKTVGTAEALPFKASAFNTIVSVTALHHADIEKAITEIKRVSKPGCIYAFTVLKKAKNAGRIRRLLKDSFKLEEIEEEKDYILVSAYNAPKNPAAPLMSPPLPSSFFWANAGLLSTLLLHGLSAG